MSNLKTLIGENDLAGDVLTRADIVGFNNRLITTRLLLLHGMSEVYYVFLDVPYDDVVDLLVQEYKDQWEGLITAFGEIDGLINYRLTTETTDTTKDTTAERDNVNKTAAYNSPELVTEGGANETNVNNELGEVNRERKEYDFNLARIVDNLTLTRKNAIIETINSDIARFLTLAVY